jgi:hypothetical protein
MSLSIVLHEVFADNVEQVIVNWDRCSVGRPKGIGGATLTCDGNEIEVMEGVEEIDAIVTDKLAEIHGGEPRRPAPRQPLLPFGP